MVFIGTARRGGVEAPRRARRAARRPHPGRPKLAYLPFGAGQRLCIGHTFAMMEASLAAAIVAQRFRLRLVPGQDIEPEPLITLRPRHGIQMLAERRSPALRA